MKFKLYIIILLFVGLLVKAQEDDLINNTWYLQKVTNHATDHFPPSNSEIAIITVSFTSDEFFTAVCNGFWGAPTYNNLEQSFTLSGAGITLGQCLLEVNTNFENIYLRDFFYDSNGLIPPLNYTIEDMGTYLLLTLTNSEDDQAFYTSENLSVKDVTVSKLKVYPNPAKEEILVEIEDYKNALILELMNETGQTVLKQKITSKRTKVNVSSLAKGVYVSLISDSKNQILKSTKIIKE